MEFPQYPEETMAVKKDYYKKNYRSHNNSHSPNYGYLEDLVAVFTFHGGRMYYK